MDLDSPALYIGLTMGALLGLLVYLFCQLTREPSPLPPILLAEEKQQALEQKRREKLAQYLAPYTIHVGEENLKYVIECCNIEAGCGHNETIECHDVDDDDDIDEGDLSFSPRLMIPMGANDFGQEFTIRSAKCAICIEEYGEGDVVVGSSNSQCPHVYHHECMMIWLSKGTNLCCPVCRQWFIVAHEEQDITATTV